MVGVVNDPIEYGVRDCGFSDHPRPLVHGDLTGDEDGLARVALLDDLEQVAPSLGGEALDKSCPARCALAAP